MWRALALPLALVACVTPSSSPPPTTPDVPAPVAHAAPRPTDEADARAVIARFLEAVDARKFADALALLSGDLQRRYTAQRLEQDFDAEPLAKERVERIRGAMKRELELGGAAARLPLAEGRAMTLVHEQAGWRIAALE